MFKLGYNNADWLLTWQIDDYFDLTSEQEDFVEERLEQHLLWHRNNELPHYANTIDEIINRAQRGINTEDYEWAINQFREAYNRIIIQILPDAVTLLRNLDSAQIKFYEEKIAERYHKRDDDPPRTEDEQKQGRSDRTIEQMEEWFGDLSDQQIQIIKELSFTLPLRYEYFHKDRLRRQNEFIALLKSDLSEAEFTEKLKTHFTEFENGRSEEYKQASEIFNQASKKMAVEISKILTEPQKQHAYEKIRNYQFDFLELASNE